MKLPRWLRSILKWIGRNSVIVIGVALLAALLWTLWVYRDGVLNCWEWFVKGPIGRESGSTTVRNLSLVIGGLIAIGLAYWRSVVADRQAKASQDQAETSQRGLLNERYQKGAEMLGSEVLAVRLGGIYALQRLAEDEPEQYHVQIMRLFCAFVRHPTKERGGKVGPDGTERKPNRIREDVQAALTAIRNRRYGSHGGIALEKNERFLLILTAANLADADLIAADLTGAVLTAANLTRANLISANPDPRTSSRHKPDQRLLGRRKPDRRVPDRCVPSRSRPDRHGSLWGERPHPRPTRSSVRRSRR